MRRRLKKRMKERKEMFFTAQSGSASVLVIMLALILIVFGVFAMMTAHSGLAIARRNAAWTQRHYDLEGEAAAITWRVSGMLADTWEEVLVANELEQPGSRTDGTPPPSQVSQSAAVDWPNLLEQYRRLVAYRLAEMADMQMDAAQATLSDEDTMIITLALPPPEEPGMGGFRAEIQVALPGTPLDEQGLFSRPVQKITAWQSLPAEVEYIEGVEFRDVEVNPSGDS
ncbi:hypothetical protein [Anoxynatronum buryatiense]|uniref:Uncharacterized protein n=1 Tax=Anoxynatronum buryatiense TaxID=489973 RepID=A0AA46AJT6_9CLOT|nr:hypothetical protein [Anoxynatronum buryatiense]SMP62874.1 hypothetical protein SAMN06296020_110118 [Anoxynatronum buryatiense]